jgi:hypothetical protein
MRSFMICTEKQMLLRWSKKQGLDGWGTWQALERKEMPAVRGQFGKSGVSCEDYINMSLKEITWDIAEGIHIYQNRDIWRAFVTKVPKFLFLYKSEIFLNVRNYPISFSKKI